MLSRRIAPPPGLVRLLPERVEGRGLLDLRLEERFRGEDRLQVLCGRTAKGYLEIVRLQMGDDDFPLPELVQAAGRAQVRRAQLGQAAPGFFRAPVIRCCARSAPASRAAGSRHRP